MRHALRRLTAVIASASCCMSAFAGGEGLTTDADNSPWARWQARLAVGALAPLSDGALGGSARPNAQGGGLVGDYYFATGAAPKGASGGFRATSGVVVGPRPALWLAQPSGVAVTAAFATERRSFSSPVSLPVSAPGGEVVSDTAALPYLGVGYSGLSLRGGWTFSADLGLTARSLTPAVKLGRVVNGSQGLEDLLRELRLSPMVQLGVSYSF
jgi:hypothetical protein